MSRLRVGSALSLLPDPTDAGTDAARRALAGIDGAPAGLILVYASVRYDLPALLAAVRSVTGDAPLVGASSSGLLCDGEFVPSGTGVQVLALGAEPYRFGVASVTDLRVDTPAAGRAVARAAVDAAGPHRAPHGAMLVLADGLTPNMQGMLDGVYRVTGATIPLVGGAAGADRGLDATYVFHDGAVLHDGAVAVWIGSDRPLHTVVGHGWEPLGLPHLVTRADELVVTELGGRPALEVFAEHTAGGLAHGELDWSYSLGLIESDGNQLIRFAHVQEGGGLMTRTPIPEFSAVQIMAANRDKLLDVSERVVADAVDGMPEPAVILTFSCVARTDLLGDRCAEEAERLHKAAAPVGTFGFYTYGEFARTTGAVGYHNATVAALAL
jgi:hypothetical protein